MAKLTLCQFLNFAEDPILFPQINSAYSNTTMYEGRGGLLIPRTVEGDTDKDPSGVRFGLSTLACIQWILYENTVKALSFMCYRLSWSCTVSFSLHVNFLNRIVFYLIGYEWSRGVFIYGPMACYNSNRRTTSWIAMAWNAAGAALAAREDFVHLCHRPCHRPKSKLSFRAYSPLVGLKWKQQARGIFCHVI